MSLSTANHRRTQTAVTTQQQQQPLVRKQHSFIEPAPSTGHCAGKYTAQQRGYLSRGLSVGRSIESIRQKLYATPVERQRLSGVGHLSRQPSVAECPARFAARVVNSKPTPAALAAQQLKDNTLATWSSTSSLLTDNLNKEESEAEHHMQQLARRDSLDSTAKAEKNKINLNIVLCQTIRATNEAEPGHSDIETATDCSELPVAKAELASHTSGSSTLSVSPALTIQRRPPLVRAMSAPVRGLDEHTKSVLSANKRQQKLRRRKLLTRNISCDRSPLLAVEGTPAAGAATSNSSGSSSKKALTRARTVVSADVITLVSLLSSEGSDSEREESSTASTPAGGVSDKQQQQQQQCSPTRRAPLLRKTGKSVSFQDSYPPTFQLASKEYSHMIRRGSIAPLAARIRANRPPTAPPVSIFLSEAMAAPDASAKAAAEADAAKQSTSCREKENNAANCNVTVTAPEPEYNYPSYARSIKERECWKLFQKMCAKGVHVSYDTVLRGMLTPTEFRHFQKQREHEEAKALEAAEAAAIAAEAQPAQGSKDQRKVPTTAIERLSDTLLHSSAK